MPSLILVFTRRKYRRQCQMRLSDPSATVAFALDDLTR